MKDPLLLQEVQILKEDLHYYNFIKSLIRLFSVRFREQVPAIGSYSILDTCGTGGNGIVYRVVSETDRRQYALKIPYLSYYMIELFDLSVEHMFDDPYPKIDEVAGFLASTSYAVLAHQGARRTEFFNTGEKRSCRREFYCLEAMKGQENAVSLLDYGTFDLISSREGVPDQRRQLAYYIMPLFQGISLSEYPGRENAQWIRWKKSAEILEKVIDLVEDVHRRGVIHRDLHPGNFLYDEETRKLYLIDFGSSLARTLDLEQDTEGENRGSRRFMSPEQFADPRSADARSDYFCIGGLLLYMLTFRSPFRRDRTRTTRPLSPEECIEKPEELAEPVFREVLNFINRLMRFERDARYQTIEEIRKVWTALAEAIFLQVRDGDVSDRALETKTKEYFL